MPDIVNFLPSNAIDMLENSRKIIISHMLEGKLPKFFIFIGVVFGVITRMFVASAVTEPYIIATVGEHKSWSFIFIIDDPSVRAV